MEDAELDQQLEKFEKTLLRQMMEVISSAKDCTPGLYELPSYQDSIVQSCREAASRMFVFQDVVQATRDPTRILEATLGIEQSTLALLEIVKADRLKDVIAEQVQEVQEHVVSLLSLISSFRIFLGKIRINSGLNTISKLSKDPKGAASKQATVVEEHSSLPHFNSVDEVVNYFVNQAKVPGSFPSVTVAEHDLRKVAPWILHYMKQQKQTSTQQAEEISDLKLELDTKTANFEKWKSKMAASVSEKMAEIEAQMKVLKLDKQGDNVELLAEKEREIEHLQNQLENTKKSLLENEMKLNATKDRMDKYLLENEEWKKQTANNYQELLDNKDRELKELRETLELLMKKDEKREQEDIMNQLLDFISNDPEKKPPQPAKKAPVSPPSSSPTPSPSVARSSPTPDLEKSDKQEKSSALDKISSDSPRASSKASMNLTQKWKEAQEASEQRKSSSPHTFKVVLPDEDSFMTIMYEKNMTLGTVLETVCKKKGWESGNFKFRHVDARAISPFLPLSLTLGQLNTPSVRMIKMEAPQEPKYKSISSMDLSGIGLPYNVFHTDHKTVEDLLALMEKGIDDEEDDQQADVPSLIKPCKGFDIELGKRMKTQPNKRLVDTTKNTPYYQHYFYNKPHHNFYSDSSQGPILVSLEQPPKEVVDDKQSINIRALVRTKFDDEFVFIPSSKAKNPKSSLVKAIETQCKDGEKLATGLKLNELPAGTETEESLLKMEQKLLSKGYKFGILYSKPGQIDENEMFANVDPSPDFTDFLEFIGTKIELQGWKDFRGGLDVKTNTTGTHSYYAKHRGLEIMFHVSTQLPFFPSDPQQLERKRHLGNDVCVIIFRDTDEPFAPDTIRSEFNHVFCVICPDKSDPSKQRFKVNFAYKDGIGHSTPQLSKPPIFEKNAVFRDFLLTKLINSERCAMYAPNFVSKIAKTKAMVMADLMKTLTSKK